MKCEICGQEIVVFEEYRHDNCTIQVYNDDEYVGEGLIVKVLGNLHYIEITDGPYVGLIAICHRSEIDKGSEYDTSSVHRKEKLPELKEVA